MSKDKFSGYPLLVNLLRHTFAENGTAFNNETLELAIPLTCASTIRQAEEACQWLENKTVGDIVPDNQIDIDIADPKDSALEVIATCDEVISKLILENSHCGRALAEVLNSALHGELQYLQEI